MKRLILSFIISTTLLSAEITKDNIHNYVYVNQHSTEFKIEKGRRDYYKLKIFKMKKLFIVPLT